MTRLPSERSGAGFASERERLGWLIREIEHRTKDGKIQLPSPDVPIVFVVTSTWLNSALTLAKAVLVLVSQELSEAVGPLQRALWEGWIEWRYLLKQSNRSVAAAKVMLSAMLEATEGAEGVPGLLNATQYTRLHHNIRQIESSHPLAAEEIRAQRRAHKFHWSGMGRAAMERTLAPGRTVYKFLSWDAHGTVAPIRDVAVNINKGTASFRFGREVRERDIEHHAWQSGGVLFYMYNDFADLWGLRPVVLPMARGQKK